MHDDDTLLGLEQAGRARQHRGGRPVFSGLGVPSTILMHGPAPGQKASRPGQRPPTSSATAEYSRDQDRADELLYTESGHMPAWAEADPTDYWDAADLYERANGRLFKRLEFALPTALTRRRAARAGRRLCPPPDRRWRAAALHPGDPRRRGHQPALSPAHQRADQRRARALA